MMPFVIHIHIHGHNTLTRVHGNENTYRLVQVDFPTLKHEPLALHSKSLQDGQDLLSYNTEYFNIDPVKLIKTTPSSRL